MPHSTPTQDAIRTALDAVMDPELHISITSMGLVYDIVVDADGTVHITMTLTTIGCPLFDTIHDAIRTAVMAVPGATGVDVDLVFDPPWTPDMMSPETRAEVGLD